MVNLERTSSAFDNKKKADRKQVNRVPSVNSMPKVSTAALKSVLKAPTSQVAFMIRTSHANSP